jgi:hypothetical protein
MTLKLELHRIFFLPAIVHIIRKKSHYYLIHCAKSANNNQQLNKNMISNESSVDWFIFFFLAKLQALM